MTEPIGGNGTGGAFLIRFAYHERIDELYTYEESALERLKEYQAAGLNCSLLVTYEAFCEAVKDITAATEMDLRVNIAAAEFAAKQLREERERIKELEQEKTNAALCYAGVLALLDTTKRERNELKERVKELEAALRKYGDHDISCKKRKVQLPDYAECTCGYRAALERKGESQ